MHSTKSALPESISQCIANLLVELQSKDLKLVSLIESLGEYLNNDDAKIRAKSTRSSSITTTKDTNPH